MRVLQVHTRYRQPGGEDAVVDAEANLLRSGGHQVDRFISTNPAGPRGAITFVAAPWNPLVQREFHSLARRASPEVVHVHNTWFAMSPSIVAAAAEHAPVVLTLHNYRLTCANGLLFRSGSPCRLCVDGSAWNGLRHLCYRGPVGSLVASATVALHRSRGTWERNVSVFAALSQFAREVFVAAGLPPERVRVKPNFVSDPGPRPEPPSRSQTVLFAGRLTPEKGLPLLLEAWRRSHPKGLVLEVAGSGPLAEQVAGEDVRYLGRLPGAELRAKMMNSRALLVPSTWYEGMPMTVLEAFSAGLPVLATRVGSLTEMVEPLGSDWLADPDPEAWSSALRSTLGDGAVDSASSLARELFEGRYAPAQALDALEGLYEEARRLSLR